MNKPSDGSLTAPPEKRLDTSALPGLADLSPAYFAMVMATGIVSLAANAHGWRTIALALFYLNLAAWAALWALNILRMVRYPRNFFGDMVDHLRGPGFFTMVASTAVLGNQLVMFAWVHVE